MKKLVLLLAAALVACTSPPPLYEGLRAPDSEVTTNSQLARRYFDQGLVLCWGFNHDEAVRAFEQATRLDRRFAMGWWGLAHALGPNINLPLRDEAKARRAHRAARRAYELRSGVSERERALIEAMAWRYSDASIRERKRLDLAYAGAMREVWRRYPDDPVVASLFADSLMLLSRKWRQWSPDGDRGPYTSEFVAVLERGLASHPEHPGLNHFYIHAVEASDAPQRALPSAERLMDLVPASGHLVHMPSHIYIRVGKYERATESNARAVAADDGFFEDAPEQGIYSYYRAHNAHFLAWSAMFQGAREQALDAARRLVAKLPREELGELPQLAEAFVFVPTHVMVRFGLWDEILAEPAPPENLLVARTLWHHARAIALANTGRIEEALAEADTFEEVAAKIPEDKRVRRASVSDLLAVAREMMIGEIRFKQGRREEAFAALRRSVQAEDRLPYAEPPGWMQPVRHALGALLLEADRAAEAEAVYRADLERHAENGWALHGLAESLRRQGREEEAQAVDDRFEAAWAHADVEIEASCYCRTRAPAPSYGPTSP